MKVIKKYFKFILCFVAFAVLSFACTFSPSLSADAAMITAQVGYNVLINSLKMPKATIDVGKGDNFEIPLLETTWQDAKSYTIRVLDPANKAHDYRVSGTISKVALDELNENVSNYFEYNDNGKISVKSLNEGEYSILYIIEDAANHKIYCSNAYNVTVKNVSYSLDFSIDPTETGKYIGKLNQLVPEYVAEDSGAIVLPTPKVVDANGNVKTGVDVKMEVRKDGGIITTETANSNLSLANGVYSINPTEEAIYTVKYTYQFGSNPPTKTFKIVVKSANDYETPEEDDITYTTPAIKSFELGDKDITLPKLTLNDTYGKNISHNVESIEIKIGNKTLTLQNNCYTFDMTKEAFNVQSYADLVGKVTIKYNVKTAYGTRKAIEVTPKNFTVTDSSKPSIKIAYDYVLTTDTDAQAVKAVVGDVNTNAAVDLRKEYGYTELYLPAVYAEDKVSEFKEFTFVRMLRRVSDNKMFYVDNLKLEDTNLVPVAEGEDGYNYSADANIGKINKAVRFQFAENVEDGSKYAGEYVLYYQVVSNTISKQTSYLYESGTTRYKLEVLSTDKVSATSAKPTVEFTKLNNNATIDSDGSMAISITSSDETDDRLKNAMFYYYKAKDAATTLEADISAAIAASKHNVCAFYGVGNALDLDAFKAYMEARYLGFEMVEASEANSKTFNLKLNNYAELNKAELDASRAKIDTATVVAVALNDAHNFKTDVRTLKINDLTDASAPIPTIINGGSFVNGETIDLNKLYGNNGEEESVVTLPEISFADADTTLGWDVKYYVLPTDATLSNATINFRSTSGKGYVSNTSFTGGTITPKAVGTYYVVYTAMDDAGNSTHVYFTFNVKDTTPPHLAVTPTVINNGEVSKDDNDGGIIKGSNGTTISFDAKLTSPVTKEDYSEQNLTKNPTVEADGLDWVQNADGSYTFYSAGTYTFRFVGSYAGNENTSNPVTWKVQIENAELKWDTDVDVDNYKQASTNSTVTVPYLTAHKGNIKADVTVKATFNGKDLKAENDIKEVIVNGYTVYQFNTTEDIGTYKIVYTATCGDVPLTKTLEIKVGDNRGPIMSLNNDAKSVLEQEITYTGDKLEYKVNIVRSGSRKVEIVVTNNGKKVYTYNTGLTLSDLDDSGEDSTNLYTLWENLQVTLTSEDGIVKPGDETHQFFIEGTGTCILKITAKDGYQNESIKEFKFKVISKGSSKEVSDTVVGVVLIIVSLVILAGVILFFTFTGKKGGNGKGKKLSNKTFKAAKQTKTEEVEVEKVEETVKEEVAEVEEAKEESKNDDEAKSGDVE